MHLIKCPVYEEIKSNRTKKKQLSYWKPNTTSCIYSLWCYFLNEMFIACCLLLIAHRYSYTYKAINCSVFFSFFFGWSLFRECWKTTIQHNFKLKCTPVTAINFRFQSHILRSNSVIHTIQIIRCGAFKIGVSQKTTCICHGQKFQENPKFHHYCSWL